MLSNCFPKVPSRNTFGGPVTPMSMFRGTSPPFFLFFVVIFCVVLSVLHSKSGIITFVCLFDSLIGDQFSPILYTDVSVKHLVRCCVLYIV